MPRSLLRNWRLKLSALGLSIFLWALVQTEPLSQETFSSVPVVVEIADTLWTTTGSPTPPTVELRLGGPAREIIRLAREGTSVVIPVSAVGSRDTVIAIQREWVQLGQRAGVTVESVSPATLRVSFEQAVTKSIPLSLRLQGELPADLAFSNEIGVNPQAVMVRGPESRLGGLDSLALEPLDLSSVRDSDIFTLAVDTSGLAGASVVPRDVMVGVRVEPLVERSLEGELVVHADARGYSVPLIVDPVSIRLRLEGARTLV
ncbi:MAG: YbbR-like domain-containing protein, partial [Gemmatimonadota bacterium]|nr:YbbR-like domain-containing protein [Gemmatimonadota bacterium]